MNKIKALGLVIVFFFSLQCLAQKRDVLILWDVTYSMKGSTANGIDPAKDIWAETKELIIAQIGNMESNGISTIHILPFQNPSDNPENLDWKVERNINHDKKDKLQKWVKDFDFPFNTSGRSTNLCGALELAMEKIASLQGQSDEIILAVYSDGGQSDASYLKGCSFDAATCVNEKVSQFCEKLCPVLSGNRFYFLKLKNYNSNIISNCHCLQDIHLGDQDGIKLQRLFTTRPSPSVKRLFLREAIQTHTINFIQVLGERPKDLRVSALSNNSNISISNTVDIDSDGNFLIEILSANVPEGASEETKINFEGLSNNNVDVTIEPLNIIIVNEQKSKVVIKGIKIK